ncbi:ribonuclease R, partial [Mesorhizobium sp. M2C.T.Ca.TU.009.01.2.1]
ILRYIAENPDRSGKREIAKAFALRGQDRIWLKDMLRDLQDEGLLTKERKRLARAGAVPHVAVLDIFGRDDDGVLLANPSEYTGAGSPPVIAIRISRGASGPVPGIGDRVLAKTFPTDDPSGPAYTGRVMKIFEKRSDAVLGVFRVLKDGTFRIEPVERRQPELIVDKEFQNGAKNGDLVEVKPARASRYGLPRAKVLAVLGSLSSEKAVSMIAIHAHDIPHVFPADVIAEAEAVKPATLDHREDWRDLPL